MRPPHPFPNLWRQEFYLVDMPGYGFALAGEKDVARWQALYQYYLTLTLPTDY
jgi:GTP-binding protein EngB required for normal cell division